MKMLLLTSQPKQLILNMFCIGIYVYCVVLFDVSVYICSCFYITSEITPSMEKRNCKDVAKPISIMSVLGKAFKFIAMKASVTLNQNRYRPHYMLISLG